ATAAAIPAQNLLIFETDVAGGSPERLNYWHGVDFTLNARFRGGLQTQFGTSTGREVTNTCSVVKFDSPDLPGCNQVAPFQTTVRGLASYTVPKLDVLVSATVRSQPASQLSAGWNVPNTVIQGLLGHLPAGSLATGNTTIQLVRTGTQNADEVLY